MRLLMLRSLHEQQAIYYSQPHWFPAVNRALVTAWWLWLTKWSLLLVVCTAGGTAAISSLSGRNLKDSRPFEGSIYRFEETALICKQSAARREKGTSALTFGRSVKLFAEGVGYIGPEGVEDIRLPVLLSRRHKRNSDCLSPFKVFGVTWVDQVMGNICNR